MVLRASKEVGIYKHFRNVRNVLKHGCYEKGIKVFIIKEQCS